LKTSKFKSCNPLFYQCNANCFYIDFVTKNLLTWFIFRIPYRPQIKRVGFDDLSPQNVSEWFCCIENTIAELNKLAIEIDKRYEMSNLQTTPPPQTAHE
ncbi:MAG: hypothetical protein WBI40_13085, partial [Methylococcaceae bacterium]